MFVILVRIFIFYMSIVFALRLTGQRQIGQLQLSELVTALLISEIAAVSITNSNVPFLHGFVPITIIISLEVIISYLATKNNIIRKLFDGSPSILLYKGVVGQKEMKESRVTMNELISAIRTSGFSSISEIEYVFLESNGIISVIPKQKNHPATPEDLSVSVQEKGVDHAIIIDGVISDHSLSLLNKSRDWLYKELKNRKLELCDVFYFSINLVNDITIIKKEGSK